jgi:hypothetical protein
VLNVQVKNIRVTNTGNSAIYYEWVFQNIPKLNPNSLKDPKPHFYCHYQPSVIHPSSEQVFSFSFYSEIPGIYVEEVALVCRPTPVTPLTPIKLKG